MKLTFGGDVKRTFCTLCPQHCGMLVKVENGRPVRFDGDRNNPVAKGKLCIKGTACIELNEHPDRLNFPLKRIGDRGSDQWEQISWEQALDEIAAKLSDIRDREGPEALATLGGTHKSPGDWSSWRFACQFGTPNFVSQGRNCGVGEFLAETAMYGWDTVYQAPHPGVTKCVMIWGSNPAESSPPSWERLKDCQAQGAKLIVIDPRVTKTAARADLHLPVRPRTDGALALGLVHVMIEEDIYDRDVRREVVPRLRRGEGRRRGVDAGADIRGDRCRAGADRGRRPDVCPEHAGPDRLRRRADPARRGRLPLGPARTRHPAVDLGQPRRPGRRAARQPLRREPVRLARQRGFRRLIDHPLRTRESVNAAETPICSITGYKAFREAMADVYPKGHTGCAYMLFASQPAIYDAILDQDPYPVRAMIVQSGEPLLTMGGAQKAYEAFKSPNLELLVVMDFWKTPTAQLADYVLPAADFLERPDITSHWGIGNFFVVGQKSAEPLFERHNDYELWAGLGRRLLDPSEWPETLEGMLDRFLAPSGKTYDDWANGEKNHFFTRPKWRKYEEVGFATPSGKVELVPSPSPSWASIPARSTPARRYAIPTPTSEEFPLQMIPGSRYRELTASNLRQSARLKRIHPGADHGHPPTDRGRASGSRTASGC